MFDVLLDINNLHNLLSEDQYQGLLKEILSKWKADPGLRSFHDYFLKQWDNSNNWQIF